MTIDIYILICLAKNVEQFVIYIGRMHRSNDVTEARMVEQNQTLECFHIYTLH